MVGMKQTGQRVLFLVLSLSLFGCQSEPELPLFPAGTTFVADPNPIRVCDGTGLGVTTLSWKTEVAKTVEVRMGSFSGDLLAHKGSEGTKTTGKWVGDGEVFYLQDASGGKTPSLENTLAMVEVAVSEKGCS